MYASPTVTLKASAVRPHSIHIFCAIFTIIHFHFLKQHSLIGLCSGKKMCYCEVGTEFFYTI
jgi:hypothetical protein